MGRKQLFILLLMALILTVLILFIEYKSNKTNTLTTSVNIDEYKDKLTKLEELNNRHQQKILELDKKIKERDDRILALKNNLPPIPSPAPEPPEKESELTESLVKLGLHKDLSLVHEPSSVLSLGDAAIVHSWGHEALRVPALELRIQKDLELQEAQDKVVEVLKERINISDKALITREEALKISQDITRATETSLKEERKINRWRVIKWGSIGLGAGYILASIKK